MKVVPIRLPRSNSPTTAVGLPFNRRNVEEWSRLDQLTGIMETAKIETDHWAARADNAAHNYGKVIDSRERNNPDGSFQERQRKQMEVFHTKVPGGSMHVIRTQTITTSSKKWATTNEKGFEDLQLPVNSLDLSSQKTKGSVGRSGSIGGRRPPSRPRSLISQSSNTNIFGEESSVFRLCQRLHEEAKSEVFKGFSGSFSDRNSRFKSSRIDSDAESERSGVVITDVTNNYKDGSIDGSVRNGLSRQKSCSNDNIAGDSDDNDSLLRRSSKVRRSLQFPKPGYSNSETNSIDDFDWSTTKSLKERAAEIENLLRQGSSNSSPRTSEQSPEPFGKPKLIKKRDSFVSAETLKEVRDRLKKPNSSETILKDDGIVTEKDDSKYFMYDRDEMINGANKKPSITGTGSLESRCSNKSSSNGSRTSEWYRRRKSYGFEQVDEYEKFDNINNKKNQIDSSTDSGICQSSETMGIPSWNKNTESYWNKINSESALTSSKPSSTVVKVRVQKDSNETFSSGLNSQPSSIYDKTSIYLDNFSESLRAENYTKDDNKRDLQNHLSSEPTLFDNAWIRKSPLPIHKSQDTRETLKSSLRSAKNPWILQLRGTKLGERNWDTDENEDSEKSPSTALSKDELTKADTEGSNQKKNKKVEFCKTEVHFSAESGKFNIVETDGKPPPNDIFRRRKQRNVGPAVPKNPNGLPETKFGDTTVEKSLMTSFERPESISEKIEAELQELSNIVAKTMPKPRETTNVEFKNPSSTWLYDVAEEPVDTSSTDTSSTAQPRSILKNYRNSYFLGENEEEQVKPNDSYETSVKPLTSSSTPLWRSTVVLRNKRFDDIKKKNECDRKLYSSDGETELQTRIRNLRKTDPDSKKLWERSPYSNYNLTPEMKRRSLPDDIFSRNSISTFQKISRDEMPSLSVAERIKQVEELKSNNYSTKINFRSGEMTVIQNGNGQVDRDDDSEKRIASSTNHRKPMSHDGPKEEPRPTRHQQSLLSCDKLTTSNPSVMRFSTHDDKTDNQKYQTTRILINFETSAKDESRQTDTSSLEKLNKNNSNKTSERMINTYGSWSSGMRKDLGRYKNDLKSTSLVRETIHVSPDHPEPVLREDIPKPSKPVHEIIDQFDSLSKINTKEKRRKPIPAAYKTPKEYTHSDLEEELKNFTENLDKDFKDIYEEEIGSIRKSKRLRETILRKPESPPKIENLVRPVVVSRSVNYFSGKSSSDEGSKKSSHRTSSRDNYDTDDSDLLADEEVRSYMSTGHGGSDSETEGAYGSSSSRKSFEESLLRLKKLESQAKGIKEIKNNVEHIRPTNVYSEYDSRKKPPEMKREAIPMQKVTSVPLHYENGSTLTEKTYQNVPKASQTTNHTPSSIDLSTDPWDGTSNSSSAVSNKQRERVSYLNVPSLSEKYSNYFQKSSKIEIDKAPEYHAEKSEIKGRLSSKIEVYPRRNKSECEDRAYNVKVSSRVSAATPKSKIIVEHQKAEKPSREKSKQSKHSVRNEYPDSTKHRIKTEKISTRRSQSEKYQIQDHRFEKRRDIKGQTDEIMLEELKKAADEILMAVNGYTDDSSHMGSSEDDRSRRILRKEKISSLGTISEGKRVSKAETRRTTMTTTHRRTTGNQSSASSQESLTKEPIRNHREYKMPTRHKHGESGKSSRATRLLQRASSREALMPQRSSSEDIPSYLEEAKKRVVRRLRSGNSTKAETTSESKTSSRSRSKNREPSSSATKTRKPEKSRDSTAILRCSKSNHIPEGEKTKSSSRRTVVAKSVEVDSSRKRRSQHPSTRDEHVSTQTHRKKISSSRKPDVMKASSPT